MRTKTFSVISAMAVFSLGAVADDGRNNNGSNSSFESSVIGSMPGMAIGGVVSGGAPWVVRQGEASVSSDGRVRVEVQGLLIATGGPASLVGTTGPVTMVGATLVCGGSGGTPVAVSAVSPSPLSSSGNAEIEQAVLLPAVCPAPVVLVRIFNSSAPLGSQLGPFIAETGLMAGAAQNQNQNQNEDGGKSNNSGGHGH